MVTISYGGADYILLAISLALLMVAAISAMKIDSIPWRLTVMFLCFGLTYPLLDFGIMYSVFAVMFGVAVIMRTVYDMFNRGAEV